MIRLTKFQRPNGYWYVRYWLSAKPVDESTRTKSGASAEARANRHQARAAGKVSACTARSYMPTANRPLATIARIDVMDARRGATAIGRRLDAAAFDTNVMIVDRPSALTQEQDRAAVRKPAFNHLNVVAAADPSSRHDRRRALDMPLLLKLPKDVLCHRLGTS